MKTTKLLLAGLLAGVFAQSAMANEGYLKDSQGQNVTAAVAGDCVTTSQFDGKASPACGGAAPAPVVKAPEPAPVPAPKAVAVTETFSLPSDALFPLGSSKLTKKGQQALAGFSAKLAGMKASEVVVTGHADRLGNAAGNQRLSLARANAVKGYLVAKNPSLAHSIRTEGKGSSQPVSQGCVGGKRTAKLVACLAADRRVEVRVTGTK